MTSFVRHFKAIGELKLGLQSRNAQFGSKVETFLSRVTSKFDVWHWKTIGHPFYATSSFVHHSIAICAFKLELQSENGSIGFWPPLWPWTLTSDFLPLVITPENFVMIRWWEHSEEGVTDGRTGGRTERSVLRAALISVTEYVYNAVIQLCCTRSSNGLFKWYCFILDWDKSSYAVFLWQ